MSIKSFEIIHRNSEKSFPSPRTQIVVRLNEEEVQTELIAQSILKHLYQNDCTLKKKQAVTFQPDLKREKVILLSFNEQEPILRSGDFQRDTISHLYGDQKEKTLHIILNTPLEPELESEFIERMGKSLEEWRSQEDPQNPLSF